MKKISIFLSLLMAMMVGFTSCDEDFAQPPMIMPEGGMGSGAWDNPLTALQVNQGASGTNVWVTGYIVGWIDTSVSNAMDETTCKFTVPATGDTNLLMADSPTETNIDKCVPIQLPKGDIRSALNLVDNAGNLGKQVTLKGNLEKYFRHAGVKSVTAFNWGDKGVQ